MYPANRLKPSSNDGGAKLLQNAPGHHVLWGGRMGMAPDLQHAIGSAYGAVLTELHFSVRGGVWTARIKADFDNTAMVAWLDVSSFPRTLEVLSEYAEKGWLPWVRDKRPPRR